MVKEGDGCRALSLAKDCYSMKLELLSSAITNREVKFVDRNNGLVSQDNEVMIGNDAAELKYNPSTEEELGFTNSSNQFEQLQGLPFYYWSIDRSVSNRITTFNNVIGLPQKNGQSMPLFDCEQILFRYCRITNRPGLRKQLV